MKNQPWVTDDVLDLCDNRRDLKKSMKTDPEVAVQYSGTNRDTIRKMKEVKEQWIVDQCTNIEAGMRTGNSKAALSTLKQLTKLHQTKSTMVEDKDGNPLTEEAAVSR